MGSHTYDKINNICLLILSAFAVTAGLIYTRAILVPFVIALFLYLALTPALNLFQNRLKAPRWVAMGLTIVSFFALFGLFALMIASSLNTFIEGAHAYRDRLSQSVDGLSQIAQSYGISLDTQSIQKELKSLPVFSMAKDLTGGVITFLGNAVLIMVFILFLFSGKPIESSTQSLVTEIQKKVSQYIVSKLLVSLATAFFIWILLVSCGVELALMFAVLTFLLNFIPNVGSLIATALPLPIILLQFGLHWEFFVFTGVALAIQFSVGNLLEPKLMGDSMDLHPVTVLIFLMFWGWVWGLPGMFMAVPITAILKIALSRIPSAYSFSELLAGRLGNPY